MSTMSPRRVLLHRLRHPLHRLIPKPHDGGGHLLCRTCIILNRRRVR